MDITFHAGGTAAAGTGSCAPGIPAVNAGEVMILAVVSKYFSNVPDAISGWTQFAQQTGGHGSAGADTGNATLTLFKRVSDGTESGTITVNVPSGNSVSARIFSWQATSGASWDVVAASGVFTSPSTSWSVTTGALEETIGDLILAFSGINSDSYTYSAQALSALGMTFGAATERMDAGTGQGDDNYRVLSEHPITAGSSSSAPTYTMTASGSATDNPAGATILVRLRQVFSGSGTGVAKKMAASGTGALVFTGSGTGVASKAAASGAGALAFAGTGAAAAKKAGASGAAALVFTGSGSGGKGPPGGFGLGRLSFILAGTPGARRPSAGGGGALVFQASGTAPAKPPGAMGTGASAGGVTGSGTGAAPSPVGAGAGEVKVDELSTLVARLRALLDGKTSAGARVFRRRGAALDSDELPAISVYALAEEAVISNEAPREYEVDARIAVELAVRAGPDRRGDDELDDFCDSVFWVLALAEASVGVARFWYELTRTGAAGAGPEADVLAARLEWVGRYYQRVDELPQPAPDLERVHGDWAIGADGAVAAQDDVLLPP